MVKSRVSVARSPLLFDTSTTPATCPLCGRVMILTFALVGRLGLATLRRVRLFGNSTVKTLWKPVLIPLKAMRNVPCTPWLTVMATPASVPCVSLRLVSRLLTQLVWCPSRLHLLTVIRPIGFRPPTRCMSRPSLCLVVL